MGAAAAQAIVSGSSGPKKNACSPPMPHLIQPAGKCVATGIAGGKVQNVRRGHQFPEHRRYCRNFAFRRCPEGAPTEINVGSDSSGEVAASVACEQDPFHFEIKVKGVGKEQEWALK
jgi:hypothetical protein